MPGFVDAVLAEAKLQAARNEVRLKTIYLGGGTPTALAEGHLERLLSGLLETFSTDTLTEFGLEANPRTIIPAKAKMLKRVGVNRISLGVQAWDQETLTTLGRDHAPEEAEETFHILRDAGFDSLNIDLMFSIPGQTLDQWSYTLDKTLALNPEHVSAYNLNYEEDTAYFERLSQGLYREDPDRDADMFFTTVDRLSAAGYAPYEISNFAKPGHESAHNAAYWAGEGYLGLGPGAVSTLHRHRWKNLPDTERYMAAVSHGFLPQVDAEQLTESEWLTERIALELRRREGLSLDRIGHVSESTLDHLAEIGHIKVADHRLILTSSGRALADSIAAQLLP